MSGIALVPVFPGITIPGTGMGTAECGGTPGPGPARTTAARCAGVHGGHQLGRAIAKYTRGILHGAAPDVDKRGGFVARLARRHLTKGQQAMVVAKALLVSNNTQEQAAFCLSRAASSYITLARAPDMRPI
jgi:hypothetical protein